MTTDGTRRPGLVWLVGVGFGAVAGLLIVTFGALLAALAVLALAVGMSARPRPVGASGTLVGLGGTWLLLVARATLACRTESGPGWESGCVAPDVRPFVALSLAIFLAGATIGIVAVRRSPSSDVPIRDGPSRPPRPRSRAARLALPVLTGLVAGVAAGYLWPGGQALAALVLGLFAWERGGERWADVGLALLAASATYGLFAVREISVGGPLRDVAWASFVVAGAAAILGIGILLGRRGSR